MRRVLIPLALLALTGTLAAQSPRTIPLTRPDRFHCKVTFLSNEQQGDTVILKNVRLDFENGLALTADQLTFDKTRDGVSQLSGNVQLLAR
jgi:hypothetical protein